MICITILDEVNCVIDGLEPQELRRLQDSIKFKEKGAHMTAAFRLGEWDGFVSMVEDDGVFGLYHIDQVIEFVVSRLGYGEDEIDLVDERPECSVPDDVPPVDETFLLKYTGHTLRDYQVDGINDAIYRRKGILHLATSAGKALQVNEPVLTPTGFVEIGDLVVGDKVIGQSGKATTVVGVYPQGTKSVYRVTMTNGHHSICCDEHLWDVRTKTDATKGRPFKTKSLKEIMNDLTNSDGSAKWQTPSIGGAIEYEACGELLLPPYLMGVLLGDGSFRGASSDVFLTNSERDIIGRVESLLPEGDFLKQRTGYDNEYRVFNPKSAKAVSTLSKVIERLGLDGKYSHEKFIPKEFMTSTLENRIELIQGMMDTDGWCGNSYEYYSSSERLANDFKELVYSVGGYANVSVKDNPTYEYNGEKLVGKTGYRVYCRFPEWVTPVSSDKHLAKGLPKPHQSKNIIESVEYVGEDECVCIKVAAEDGLFVTRDYIVTHNTQLTLGISKLLDPYIKTITIVPSAQLAKQTYDDYQLCEDIKSCLLTAKDSQQKRLDKIKENRHFVITEKLFLNLVDEFEKDTYAVMKDECQVLGSVLEEALRYRTPHYPIRIGLTGTIPTDLYKAERIKCVLGGGVLRHVSPAELISRGLAAKPTIKLVTVSHKEIESLFKTMRDEKEFEWSIEQNYMSKNVERAEAIATYINKIFKDDTKNTLVLCHAAFGKVLSKVMNLPIITDDVSVDERREMFSQFKTEDDHIQLASFGTSSTGISENRIFRLVMVDVGKDETTIIQSIGRGIRLDGVHNKVDVIDISSNTFYSTKHRKERIKVYKREKYDYHEDSNFIYV